MKKRMLLLCVVVVLFCSSCGKEKDKYEYGEIIARRMNGIILEAIENDEPEKIKELLCERILDEHENIDREIEEFIHFIDGDIVSVGKQWGDPAGHTTEFPYGLIYERYTGRIYDITTDTGKKYKISFFGYNVNLYSPDEIGLYTLSIVEWDWDTDVPIDECERYDIYLQD